jgi:hypothetical protein
MHNEQRRRALGALLAMAALPGCGGGDGAAASAPPPAPPAAPTPPAPVPPAPTPPTPSPPTPPSGNVIVGGRNQLDLSVDGRIFEVDLAQDYNPWTVPGNGGVIQRFDTGGYGGMPGVELRGPTTYVNGSTNVEYTSILGAGRDSAQLSTYQINFGYFVYFKRNWSRANGVHGPKYLIVLSKRGASGEVGGVNRPMVFIGGGGDVPAGYACVGLTEARTVAYYQNPPLPDHYWPAGGGRDALYVGPAPDHRGLATQGTPVIGDEWVWMEHRIDFANHRGNPRGRHSLGVWTRDGVLAGTMLDISLGQNDVYTPEFNMFGALEGLGHYWNFDSTRMADDGMVFSRPRLAANLAIDQWMGPPAGFVGA